MKFKSVFLICIFFCTLQSHAQSDVAHDLFFWNWYQFSYKLSKKDYVSFQFQNRLKENMSLFNKNNFYFDVGRNFNKNISAEVLYQLTTNYNIDNHTFYAGLTFKRRMDQFKIHYRTSVQHIRNYFTGDYKTDKPFFEWRNRVRIIFPLLHTMTASLSAEPYIKFEAIHKPYLSRIRNVAQLSYNLNRYHAISFFYLYEPEIITYSKRKDDYVIGITYSLSIPRKWKNIQKIFEFQRKEDRQILKETKEFFY